MHVVCYKGGEHLVGAMIWGAFQHYFFYHCNHASNRTLYTSLYKRSIDSKCRSKVAWNVILLPVSNGGLGIIDPFDQLVVRGLLPSQGGNLFLRNRIQQCCPSTYGQ